MHDKENENELTILTFKIAVKQNNHNQNTVVLEKSWLQSLSLSYQIINIVT